MREISLDTVFEQHKVPRAVSASSSDLLSEEFKVDAHSHEKAELLLCLRGVVTCEVASGFWIVPAHCALWIPAGHTHSVSAVGDLDIYCLCLEADIVSALPQHCCTIGISPLLRELIIAVSGLPVLYDPSGSAKSLIETTLNELEKAPIARLHVPLPADSRLRRIAQVFATDPTDRSTMIEWSRRVGMSERSLFRLVQREVGMSFGQWRQQFQIIIALRRLAEGDSVQSVAFDLGYESASSFCTMFRKALGQSPGKYLASHRRLQ
jgi:AraC-like DNA-binding protein